MTAIPLELKFDDWPERDQVAWGALFACGGLFEDRGGGAHWTAATQRMLLKVYGRWLSFLARSDSLDPRRAPEERVTVAHVRAFHEELCARVSPVSVAMTIDGLLRVMRPMAPDTDWQWLERVSSRCKMQAGDFDLKPRPGVSSRTVLVEALRLMADLAESTRGSRRSRAWEFRDALMLGLVASRPLRLRTFAGIRIGRHLRQEGDGFVLRFKPEDMKDRKSHDYLLPDALIGPMKLYLADHRPLLLGTNETDFLWVSRLGGRLLYEGVSAQIYRLTERLLGLGYRPHAFRHIAATSIAEEDPTHVNIIASVLGHSTLVTAERHYNRASMVSAVNRWQAVVKDTRRQWRNDRTRS